MKGTPLAQRILTVTSWDAFDRVWCGVRVREYDGNDDTTPTTVLDRTTSIPSTGEDDPEEWARDALVALIEAL